MEIKVLGPGCPKCMSLERNINTALERLGLTAHVEHIKDMNIIMSFGVMVTPALVIDDNVVSSGRALTPDQVTRIIQEARK